MTHPLLLLLLLLCGVVVADERGFVVCVCVCEMMMTIMDMVLRREVTQVGSHVILVLFTSV